MEPNQPYHPTWLAHEMNTHIEFLLHLGNLLSRELVEVVAVHLNIYIPPSLRHQMVRQSRGTPDILRSRSDGCDEYNLHCGTLCPLVIICLYFMFLSLAKARRPPRLLSCTNGTISPSRWYDFFSHERYDVDRSIARFFCTNGTKKKSCLPLAEIVFIRAVRAKEASWRKNRAFRLRKSCLFVPFVQK